MKIGFSTGSLAKGDFRHAIKLLQNYAASVIELSALRESELDNLISSLETLDLSHFSYISFHAPSKLEYLSETQLIEKLLAVKRKGLRIVLHPDIITDFEAWKVFGDFLCLENMDKRKPIGRTAKDMEFLFDKLPEASFCLDMAHARQVDPSMTEALIMIQKFKNRLKQIHLSDVNSNSIHEPLNVESILSYHRLASLLGKAIPIIIESPVNFNRISNEMNWVPLIFDHKLFSNWVSNLGVTFNNPVNRMKVKSAS